ncbi:MAG: cytochrome P450 [Acidimicrobiales bacterium]|nr:cytochrome P450 [Acidimicrobiales bacterium]
MTETIHVDHHDRDWVRNRHEHYAELRAGCPVVFNEAHGGFWMVTDYASVAEVARDNETFAHKYELGAADGIDYHGICGVPRKAGTPRMGVSEIDGPEHADLRRVINPHMVTKAVMAKRERLAHVSAWFLDEMIEAGSGDLVNDYASPVPGVMTLEMMGMPSTNWKYYADFFHATSSFKPSDDEFQQAIARVGDMFGELGEIARHRRENPGDDLTSAIVTSEIDGRLLTDDEVAGILWNLVAGGLDTTTSLVSWGLHHLGTHPDDRRRLIEDPALIPGAVEEFLRFYSPSESLTRTATRDVELGGRQIKRGDVVFISWVAANHDPDAFPEADRVVIDRPENKHLAFGLGGHRCIGSSIARIESELMIADVLDRMPDYEIDPDGFRPYPGNLLMTGVVTMPVIFTPAGRSGVASPF